MSGCRLKLTSPGSVKPDNGRSRVSLTLRTVLNLCCPLPLKEGELKPQSEHSSSKIPFPLSTPSLCARCLVDTVQMLPPILPFPGSLPPLSCSGQKLALSSTALSLAATMQLPGRPCCLHLHGVLRPALAPLLRPANTITLPSPRGCHGLLP